VESIGRPKALDPHKVALAQRMHASGESASTIASTLGVSRATVYRVLAEAGDE
jgi:DNA invertase Pin-like site-specific DNA recombinase